MDDAQRIRTLLTFYRASNYEAALPDGRVSALRVGEPAPAALRAWIGSAWPAAYLTACNPHSQALTPAQNAQRLEALLRELGVAGVDYLRGDGSLPGERWREPSVLTRGLDLDAVDGLARRHAQNAVLVVRAGTPVRLRLYREDWRALAAPAPDLEWA